MRETGQYNTELHLFKEETKIPKINTLRSLRWSADNGLYGHYPLSMPKGDYFFVLTDTEIVNFVAADNKRKSSLPVEVDIAPI